MGGEGAAAFPANIVTWDWALSQRENEPSCVSGPGFGCKQA